MGSLYSLYFGGAIGGIERCTAVAICPSAGSGSLAGGVFKLPRRAVDRKLDKPEQS